MQSPHRIALVRRQIETQKLQLLRGDSSNHCIAHQNQDGEPHCTKSVFQCHDCCHVKTLMFAIHPKAPLNPSSVSELKKICILWFQLQEDSDHCIEHWLFFLIGEHFQKKQLKWGNTELKVRLINSLSRFRKLKMVQIIGKHCVLKRKINTDVMTIDTILFCG